MRNLIRDDVHVPGAPSAYGYGSDRRRRHAAAVGQARQVNEVADSPAGAKYAPNTQRVPTNPVPTTPSSKTKLC